jgi:hypothetical protein
MIETDIQKTLKYMNSKKYKDTIINTQKELKDLTSRDINFFNMGKECFRAYVLRSIDEKMRGLHSENRIKALKELKEELKIK